MIDGSGIMKKVCNFICKYKYQALLVLLYLVLFYQMQNVFFYGDDYEILYPYHNSHDFFNVLKFVMDKMHYFWYEWSGRIAVHFTATFGSSMFGISFFRFLNPIMIFTFCYLLTKIFSLFKDCNFYKVLTVISLCVIGLNISISRDTLYWLSSTIPYIWFFNLTLLTIYIVYKNYLLGNNISKWHFLILVLICITQTFALEQITFILLSFFSVMLFFADKTKINRKQLFILLCLTIISFLIVSFCPGNISRSDVQNTELVGFSYFEILLGKCYKFLCYMLDTSCLGSYVLVLSILVKNVYDNSYKLNKTSLSSIIFYVYFIIVLFNIFFPNSNIFLNFADSIDTLEFGSLNYIAIIFQIFIFSCFLLNLIYMIFKTLKKEKRFFLNAFLISLISSMMPILCVRFVTLRYFIYPLIVVIILSILYYESNFENKGFKIENIILLGISLGFKWAIIVCLIVTLIHIFVFKSAGIKIFGYLIMMILFYNIITTLVGYYKNGIIYRKNIESFENAVADKPIFLEEVPYENRLYTWHAIELDYNHIRQYYGFYLEDFYENYYEINVENVYIYHNVNSCQINYVYLGRYDYDQFLKYNYSVESC